MTCVEVAHVTLLNYVAEDIALARQTARLASKYLLSSEQFMYQERQLERALERLAEYREMLMVGDRSDITRSAWMLQKTEEDV